jgi:hypothetical protein
MLSLLLWMLAGQSLWVSPEGTVQAFAEAYVKTQHPGLLDDRKARKALSPYLSKGLRKHLDELKECQNDWVHQQPRDTTDKPPLVDCCFFSGMPDGVPTSFTTLSSERMPDGRTKVVVEFSLPQSDGTELRWRDAMLLVNEGSSFFIDDVLYNVGDTSRDSGHLAGDYQNCKAGKWVE